MEKIFKAKRLDNGEWVEFDLDTYSCHRKGCTPYIDKHFAHQMPINKDTICQYTGIKDSEGNRIFFNDEAKDFDGNKCVVSFNERIQQTCIKYYDGSEFMGRAYVLEGLTLSGHNIHEKGE